MEPIPLSAEDRAILDLEGPTVAGHTCKVIRLADPGVGVDALRKRIAARIDSLPIMRARLGGSRDAPAWVDDPAFEIDHHVAAPRDGAVSEAELPVLVGRLFEQRLDREHALWRIDLVALADGGSALIWRLHHALADGNTAMRLAAELLWDEAPGPAAPRPSHAVDDRRRRGHLAGFVAREFTETVRDSPFDGEVGTSRSVAFATLPFAPLHAAAKRDGATVNDAVLAAVGGGLRRWLAEHHDPVGALRVRVPVSLHHEGEDAANHDSFFTLPLPLGEADVRVRMLAIAAAETKRKGEHDAEHLDSALRSLREASPRLAAFAERVQAGPRSFAVCISNIRGPQGPVAIAGSAVGSMYTLAEVGRRHGLRVAVVSGAGRLGFGFCADPAIAPDLGAMARGTEIEAQALIAGD